MAFRFDVKIRWEAIEHKGPGQYDAKYLDYVQEVVKIAGEFGFYVYIDPHQDVWSRMSGGDGAPGWCGCRVGTFADRRVQDPRGRWF